MAELALGIIPMVGVAIKSYSVAASTLRACRHCSRNLRKVTKRFKRLQSYFRNECCLLLRFALDDEAIAAMKDNIDHENWSTTDFESRLQSSLEAGYEDAQSLVESIQESLGKLATELSQYDELVKAAQEENCSSDVLRRLTKRVKATINTPKYEEVCKELKESNMELTALREQVSELQYPRTSRRPVRANRCRGDWGAMCMMRRRSVALHQGLQEVLSCHAADHKRHSLSMFLQYEQKRHQSHDLLIAIFGQQSSTCAMGSIVSLHVQSERLWSEDMSLSVPPSGAASYLTPPSSLDEPPIKRSRLGTFDSSSSGQRGASSHVEQQIITTHSPASSTETLQDLRFADDACAWLNKSCIRRSNSGCFAFLDSGFDEKFRHKFYSSSQQIMGPEEVVPLNEAVKFSNLGEVSVLDRLKLARTVSVAALTYHPTPWLSEIWRLGDLRFVARTRDPGACFQTLHLTTDISGPLTGMHMSIDQPMDTVALASQVSASGGILAEMDEDQRLCYGINNTILHSLGVALLGIDRWRDLDPSDILGVRKAAKRSMFGPKYKTVVDQCLGGHFREHGDLRQPKVERQVYETVVGALEDMIAGMEIADD